VLRCAVLCCAVLCCAELCRAALCCAVLCCAVLCCAVPRSAVLCCTVLRRAVLCRAALCCAVLCCAVLCCSASQQIAKVLTICSAMPARIQQSSGTQPCTYHTAAPSASCHETGTWTHAVFSKLFFLLCLNSCLTHCCCCCCSGTAFPHSERERLGVRGLLPPRVTSLTLQVHGRRHNGSDKLQPAAPAAQRRISQTASWHNTCKQAW
jgi:hypothetical protein